MARIVHAALAFASIAAAGCASVPMAPADADRAAKEFHPAAADRAQLYVYRNELDGWAVVMPVSVDGKVVGATASKTFLVVPLDPGPHTLLSTGQRDNSSRLELTADRGATYYVWQKMRPTTQGAGPDLQLVEAQVGKAGVLECSLADPTSAAAATQAAPSGEKPAPGSPPKW
jgi:hypothetical protein